MIDSEAMYHLALQRAAENRAFAQELRARLPDEGFTPEQIEVLMQPIEAYHADLLADIRIYEQQEGSGA